MQTGFTLQLRRDISSTEVLDEPGPSRSCYLHKPITLTCVKYILKLLSSTLSGLQQDENSMDNVITKNLPVGGFTGLRDCNVISICRMEEGVMTIFCLFCRTQYAYRYLKQTSTEVKLCLFSRLNVMMSTHTS